MIKGAKKINFQFSLQAYIRRKKKGKKEGGGGESMSSHFEVMFWMCSDMKLVSRASEFPKENALLNLAVSTCCSIHLCSWHAWHSQSNLAEKLLNIKFFFLHLHSWAYILNMKPTDNCTLTVLSKRAPTDYSLPWILAVLQGGESSVAKNKHHLLSPFDSNYRVSTPLAVYPKIPGKLVYSLYYLPLKYYMTERYSFFFLLETMSLASMFDQDMLKALTGNVHFGRHI